MVILPNQPLDIFGVKVGNSLNGSMDYFQCPTAFDVLAELKHVDKSQDLKT